MNKLCHLGNFKGFECFEYRAGLFHYFYKPMAYYERLKSRMIRETLDYIRGGYKVVYLFDKKQPVAYLTIVKGGGRYGFANSKDIIICNVWVDPNARGRGLGNIIYEVPFQLMDIKYDNAYCFIRHDNIPSIKAACKAGFTLVSDVATVGYLHKMKQVEISSLGLYKLNN